MPACMKESAWSFQSISMTKSYNLCIEFENQTPVVVILNCQYREAVPQPRRLSGQRDV